MLIVTILYSTGEDGSYDATEERQKQIIRDRLKANAVYMCVYILCTYIRMYVYMYMCMYCMYACRYLIRLFILIKIMIMLGHSNSWPFM